MVIPEVLLTAEFCESNNKKEERLRVWPSEENVRNVHSPVLLGG